MHEDIINAVSNCYLCYDWGDKIIFGCTEVQFGGYAAFGRSHIYQGLSYLPVHRWYICPECYYR